MPAKKNSEEATLEVSNQRRPTMAEIARLAGVDVSTVSRALAGSPRVKDETRVLIDKVVRETGYVVNERARSLRDGRANQILVVVSDIAAPFYSDVVQGIVETLAERGINVLLGLTLRQPEREEQLVSQLLKGTVDGLITVTGNIPDSIRNLQSYDKKIVAISRPILDSGVTCVTIDNRTATEEVMCHLREMGHRRISYISGPDHSETYRTRRRAYQGFMRENSLADFQNLQSTDSFYDDAESGFEIMQSMLDTKDRPTAVFCATDELAFGAIAAAREAGLSIPTDVSFVGFDDLKLTGLMHPPLSTVAVPRFEMGCKGAEVLFDQVYGDKKPSGTIVMNHKLVLRDSVAKI